MIGTGLIIEVDIRALKGEVPDFSLEFYVERGGQRVSYDKNNLVRIETEEGARFYAFVDSYIVGRGNLMCAVTMCDKEPLFPERKVEFVAFTGVMVGGCNCAHTKVTRCGDFEFSFSCVEDIPKDTMAGVYCGIIKEQITGYEYITEAMVKRDLTFATIENVENVTISVAPGDKVVILVPLNDTIVPMKDNGFGGKMAFDTKLMGANGDVILRIGYVDYKVYGEFMTVAGDIKILFG